MNYYFSVKSIHQHDFMLWYNSSLWIFRILTNIFILVNYYLILKTTMHSQIIYFLIAFSILCQIYTGNVIDYTIGSESLQWQNNSQLMRCVILVFYFLHWKKTFLYETPYFFRVRKYYIVKEQSVHYRWVSVVVPV